MSELSFDPLFISDILLVNGVGHIGDFVASHVDVTSHGKPRRL
jgi:hypothetical protein